MTLRRTNSEFPGFPFYLLHPRLAESRRSQQPRNNIEQKQKRPQEKSAVSTKKLGRKRMIFWPFLSNNYYTQDKHNKNSYGYYSHQPRSSMESLNLACCNKVLFHPHSKCCQRRPSGKLEFHLPNGNKPDPSPMPQCQMRPGRGPELPSLPSRNKVPLSCPARVESTKTWWGARTLIISYQ